MILTKPIIKNIINGVIAPHGMTDLIHAQQHQLVPQLLKINIGSVALSLICNQYNEMVLNALFFMSSIIHFRHDMPQIKRIPRFIWSSLLIFGLFFLHPELFILYMIAIHVPHHYQMSWFFIRQEKWRTFFTILFSTYFFLHVGNKFEITNSIVLNLSKGFIISHIIYGESFIISKK
jgi:hypothetical protein